MPREVGEEPDAAVPAPRPVLTATAPEAVPSEPAVPAPPSAAPPPTPALPVPRTADAAIPAVPAAPRIEEAAPAEPRVEVRIGRVELRVDRPAAPPPPAPPRQRPAFSDYDRARRGLGRGWY